MASSAPLAAVVVIRSKAGEGSDFFAAEAPEFGQANDERDCGAGADTLDGDEQGEPAGKLPILCDKCADQQHSGFAALLEAGNILFVQALEVHFPARLGHGLENDDLLLDLLEIGQLGIEPVEAGIRQRRQLIKAGREGGDQRRVELVVLGPLEPALGKMAHLARLKAAARHAGGAQMQKQPPVIAARGFEADALNTMLGKEGIEPLQPGFVVTNAQMRAGGVERYVELGLRHIDPGANHASISHLRRPCLGFRTETFMQPYGPDEEAGRDPAPRSPKGFEVFDPTTGRRAGAYPPGQPTN